ncbi:MAG: hypothetical protein EA369_04795 [Bradymonadales bacterium]|nr:MAG: hypothetical protein EA369_04795 [Bradymonadales bacterium]
MESAQACVRDEKDCGLNLTRREKLFKNLGLPVFLAFILAIGSLGAEENGPIVQGTALEEEEQGPLPREIEELRADWLAFSDRVAQLWNEGSISEQKALELRTDYDRLIARTEERVSVLINGVYEEFGGFKDVGSSNPTVFETRPLDFVAGMRDASTGLSSELAQYLGLSAFGELKDPENHGVIALTLILTPFAGMLLGTVASVALDPGYSWGSRPMFIGAIVTTLLIMASTPLIYLGVRTSFASRMLRIGYLLTQIMRGPQEFWKAMNHSPQLTAEPQSSTWWQDSGELLSSLIRPADLAHPTEGVGPTRCTDSVGNLGLGL